MPWWREPVWACVWHTVQTKIWKLDRSEEHTSELQSRQYLVCRLLLEKKTYQVRLALLSELPARAYLTSLLYQLYTSSTQDKIKVALPFRQVVMCHVTIFVYFTRGWPY